MYKKTTRRQFVRNASIISGSALVLPAYGSTFSTYGRGSDSVIADTSYGKVRGIDVEGVKVFKGIPYAGSVSNDRRFRRPGPLESWTGVRDTLEFGAPSIQSPRRNEPAPAEDCLFLNIWTPALDNVKRPVMFYNHGGGYVIGSGASGGQDGSNLARFFDVVVVETNHRLGLLGFLYLDEIAGPDYSGSGNMGILDITAGLKWVNENISHFGGDPDNVMIFGESGGGGKTSCLYAMPEADPFFNKASIESGPGVRMLTQEMAAETTANVFKKLNIPLNNWRKILDVPAADLLKIQSEFPFVPPYQEKIRGKAADLAGFGPVVDGVALPYQPFDPAAPVISRNKPLMVGWNEDEYTFFAWERKDTSFAQVSFDGLTDALRPEFGNDTETIVQAYRKANPTASAPEIIIAIRSIVMMGLGSVVIAEKKTEQEGAPVFLYNFGYKSEMKVPGTDFPMGTPHAMDISFKFNNEVPPKEGEEPRPSFGGNNPDRYVASKTMAELWTSFARNGTPSSQNAPEWPAYNLTERPAMRIDTQCKVINDRYRIELDMWRSIGRLS